MKGFLMRRLLAALMLVATMTVGVVALDSPADAATPPRKVWWACKVIRLPQYPGVVKLWCIPFDARKVWAPIPR